MEPTTLLELLKQGGLTAVLAIVLFALYKKDQALTSVHEKRIADNNRLATVIEATNTASRALEVTSENRSRVIESVGEATRATADAIRSQAAILDQVRQTITQNHAAIALLRDDFDDLNQTLKQKNNGARRAPRRAPRVTKGTSGS